MEILEATVEALSKAKELGFQRIIVLTGSKEQAKIANLHYLRQQGVMFNIKAASKLILSIVFECSPLLGAPSVFAMLNLMQSLRVLQSQGFPFSIKIDS